MSPRPDPAAPRRSALPVLVVLALAGLAPAARAEEAGKPYRPIPAEVGASVSAPEDLVKTVRALNAAAKAKDAEATFALLADKVSLVLSGLTPAGRREAEEKGPWPSAGAALEEIGAATLEGDLAASGKVDLAAAQRDQAFAILAEATERPEWGRDPLAKGAYCTYRGVRWDAAAGRQIDDGSRGLFVPASATVFASAAPKAAVLGTLKPGLIYLHGEMDDLPDGWSAVRLPSGRTGAARDAEVRDPATVGVCLKRNASGAGWLVVAVSSALL